MKYCMTSCLLLQESQILMVINVDLLQCLQIFKQNSAGILADNFNITGIVFKAIPENHH